MSGINILRRLLLREAAKDSGQASGILSIGDSVRKLADRKLDSYIISAKKQGIDLDAMNEQQLKYILELNKPKNKIKVISQNDPEFENIMNQMLGKKKTAEVFDLRGKKIKDTRNIMGGEEVKNESGSLMSVPDKKGLAGKEYETKVSVDSTINKINNMESIASIKEMNKVIKREGKYKNFTDEDVDKIFKATEDRTSGRLDEIDPDDYDPYQTGGRVGLKAGMSRRAFLQLMGGVGAGIGAAKTGILKMFGKGAGKQAAKEIVKTPPVAGKPEWFDSLVNKVILQGDDVTEKLSVQDRQVVHNLKIDDMEDVTVYRNLDDGQIRVSYDSPDNMGEQSVELVFKPGIADETTKGKPADQFYAVEAEPRGVRMGPDDYEIEFDGENLVDDVNELISDTSRLKQVARGDKKPTLKEFVESKKKKDKTKALNEDQVEQAEYLETKYGPAPDEGDPNFQNFDMSEDFASGGIARMLGE